MLRIQQKWQTIQNADHETLNNDVKDSDAVSEPVCRDNEQSHLEVSNFVGLFYC